MTLIDDACDSLLVAALHLVLPAILFGLLAVAARGFGAFRVTRAAWSEIALNLAFYVLDALLIAPPLALLIVAMKAGIDGTGIGLPPTVWEGWPTPLVMLAAVFAGDFIGYWRHRLEHTAALWPSHAIHHSDTEMGWLGLIRMHPINRLSTTLVDNGLLLLCGFPPSALLVNTIVRHYWGFFVHADLPWTLGPLRYLLVSPAMHRWHHANERAARDTNYATVFSLFDRLFGTYRVPGPCTAPLGVGFDVGSSLAGQLAHPLRPSSYGWLRRSTARRLAALRGSLGFGRPA